MNIESFFKFVEIRTKLASVTPFLIGSLYALYRYGSLKLENLIIMFISLICFDMATTAINNYIDYKKAHNRQGYNYEKENAIVRYGVKESTALAVVICLLVLAAAFGVLLTIKTDLVVLLIGMLCFATGILYTFGPIPISRMPLGEIFSGFFMGFIIMFLAVYIHIFDKGIVSLSYSSSILTLGVNLPDVFSLFLISIPAVMGIGNIMLANNICDVDEDFINKRYTLPHFIGRVKALRLFRALYYIGYLGVILAAVINIAPLTILLVLTTMPIVNKNIKLFTQNPSKGETFGLSVKNFFVVNGVMAIAFGIAIVFKYTL